MGGNGKGWVMLWVVGALFAATLTGFGSRGFSAGGGTSALIAERNSVSAPGSDVGVDPDDEEATQPAQPDTIILERSGDGHFYADAEVNGETIRMLVDTGASAIALSREDARRAGIGTSVGMLEVVGQGASGDVHGEVVTIDRIALGNIVAEEFDAVVLDQGEMSLLGQSFLGNFDSVEITGDRMILR